MTKSGFVLPVILLFLMIFSLLAVSALTTSELALKMSFNTKQNLQNFVMVDTGLKNIADHLTQPESLPCFIPGTLSQPWRSKDYCTFNIADQSLHYVIEPLIDSGTACISNSHQQKANFYRVSVWVAEKQYPSVILQATTALASTQKCDDNIPQIRSGLLSWREIL